MTIIDRIFQEVAGISIPHFFITVEFSAMGCEMPKRIEAFLWEKYYCCPLKLFEPKN